jgi:formylglycine-generating enzyme required for sulfatase activity
MIRWTAALLLAGSAAEAQEPRVETVAIPGTKAKFDLVRVPAGKLGAVDLPSFWIGAREVSFAEYWPFYAEEKEERVVDGITRPSKGKPYFGQVHCPDHFLGPGRPAINLRWHNAVAYCEWLSHLTGAYYRLPTEAEWEYAARAGQGAEPAPLGDHAWFKENSEKRTREPGGKKPNAWGLHDALGNVWEYALEHEKAGQYAPVLRGGAWESPAAEVKFAARALIVEEWIKADPQSPRSIWWLTGAFCQGMRVVRAAEAAGRDERRDYARKLKVDVAMGAVRAAKIGDRADKYQGVTGVVENAGDRALDEVELVVSYLDPKGKRVTLGSNSQGEVVRAIYSKCYPVLVTGTAPGHDPSPLMPGGKRAFAVELPLSLDPVEEVVPNRFGAAVTNLRFAAR